MHVRGCTCDDCLPGVPASVTRVVTTEPAELPMWRRRSIPNFEAWLAAREEQIFTEQFPDPEARKRAQNARSYAKRKLLDDPLDAQETELA